MSRRRWVYIDGVPHEIGDDYVPEVRDHHRVIGDLHYANLQAQDGTDISTRAKHREYMRRNNLTTVDDFTQYFANAEKKRDAYRTTGQGGATRREDVGRAIHQLEQAQRRRR